MDKRRKREPYSDSIRATVKESTRQIKHTTNSFKHCVIIGRELFFLFFGKEVQIISGKEKEYRNNNRMKMDSIERRRRRRRTKKLNLSQQMNS